MSFQCFFLEFSQLSLLWLTCQREAEFFTIYGTFNSARELMRPYLVDYWYIMKDNRMLLAAFHTFSQNYIYISCQVTSLSIKFKQEDISLSRPKVQVEYG